MDQEVDDLLVKQEIKSKENSTPHKNIWWIWINISKRYYIFPTMLSFFFFSWILLKQMDVLLSVKIQKKENNNTLSLYANFMELRINIQQIVLYMFIFRKENSISYSRSCWYHNHSLEEMLVNTKFNLLTSDDKKKFQI